MAGYSPADNSAQPFNHYYPIFVEEIHKNLELYWQCVRWTIPPSGKTVGFYSKDDPVGGVPVQEIMNWKNITHRADKPLTANDPEIEKLVRAFGAEVAFSVEFLIRMEAFKYGGNKDVRNLAVLDVFNKADGSPNLSLNIVANAPCSVFDPCAVIPGWVSYKFCFAVGFPSKGR